MDNPSGRSMTGEFATTIDAIVRQYSGQWLVYDGLPLTRCESRMEERLVKSRYERTLVPDKHDFAEIFICMDGDCAVQLEDQYYRLLRGSVAVIPPDTIHNEIPRKKGGHIGIWITIDRGFCMLHLSGKQDGTGFYTVEGQLLNEIACYGRLVQEMSLEISTPTVFSYELIKSCLMQILITALREISERKTAPDYIGNWKETIVEAVKRYAENSDSSPISLKTIAHETHMSENYLNILFKSEVGKTIMQYVKEFRINKAKHLLTATDASIKSIAIDLGYYDQYHFSKSFKKAFGMSPSRFRKTN